MADLHIRPEVADRLGFYVYLYVDPRDGKAFYVGKGQGSRALAHLSASAESRKVARLRELAEAGLEPRIDILAHAEKLKVKRWEFTGHTADEGIRARYVGGSVAAYFRQGQQTPTAYVNC